jgi:hypothetical protein
MMQVTTEFSGREIVVPMTRSLSHPLVFQTFRTMVYRFIALRCAAGYAGIKSFRWNFYQIHPAVFQTFRTMVYRFIALRWATGYAGIKSFRWNFYQSHPAVFQTFLTMVYRFIALRGAAGYAGIRSFLQNFQRRRIRMQTVKGIVIVMATVMATATLTNHPSPKGVFRYQHSPQGYDHAPHDLFRSERPMDSPFLHQLYPF